MNRSPLIADPMFILQIGCMRGERCTGRPSILPVRTTRVAAREHTDF